MGSPVSVVRHLIQGTEITWFLAVIVPAIGTGRLRQF